MPAARWLSAAPFFPDAGADACGSHTWASFLGVTYAALVANAGAQGVPMTTGQFEGTGDTRPYAASAGFYAEQRHALSGDFVAALVAVMGWTTSDQVVDLGAGPAQIARRMAPFLAEVVAVDPESDMLLEGKRRAEAEGVTNIRFVEGSSDDLSALGPSIVSHRGSRSPPGGCGPHTMATPRRRAPAPAPAGSDGPGPRCPRPCP